MDSGIDADAAGTTGTVANTRVISAAAGEQVQEDVGGSGRVVSSYQGIRVTIIVRAHNRYILNYPSICALIQSQYHSHLDHQWFGLHRHVVMESLPLHAQVELMRDTDVLISIHGTAFVNTLFMRPDSVAIALMQSHHVEYVLPPVVEQAGVKWEFVYVVNQSRTSHCMTREQYNRGPELYPHIPLTHLYPEVCNGYTMIQAGRMECLGIRMCSVQVDLDMLEAVLLNSFYHVLAFKYPDTYNELEHRPL